MKRNIVNLSGRLFVLLAVCPLFLQSQDFLKSSGVHGNFQTDFQYYKTDSVIEAPDVPEETRMNAFANIIYTNNNFSAGFRYESYLNPLLGYEPKYEGTGIPYRFASYSNENLEVTVGSYYEQFGNGLVFRSYEERNLGYDNAMDGVRLKYSPYKGITIKGIIGKQRYYWDKGPGIVRGIDAEVLLNDMLAKWQDKKTRIILGGSFVSKYQKDDNSTYKLPENVSAEAIRLNISRGKISFMTEYAYKINDPSFVNNYIYKPGEALLLSTSYSKKGLGIILSAKRIDNMNYRSDRSATINDLNINYLPALTKQHAYSLSSIYPYASQPNGEMAFQAEIVKTIEKGTKLGGAYGTNIAVNYSRANSIDKTKVNPDDTLAIGTDGTLGYKSDFFKIGDEKYFEDFNIEITRKFSKNLKAIFSYVYLTYNGDIIEGHPGMVYADIGIMDMTYKFSTKKSLRTELQYLYTKQDDGEWMYGMFEYTIAPKWFFAVFDQYNFGNPEKDKQLHYYGASMGFTKGTNRFALTYGRQRKGIFCVGGVCRDVPASNGLLLTITSSF